jgi:hypothetical protein
MEAAFLGAGMLILIQQTKVTVHNLSGEAAAVTVVQNSPGSANPSSAISRDGAALCLGRNTGSLAVYDVATLRAEPLSSPRQEAQLAAGIAGIARGSAGRGVTVFLCGPPEHLLTSFHTILIV